MHEVVRARDCGGQKVRPITALYVFPAVDRFASAVVPLVHRFSDQPVPGFVAGDCGSPRCYSFDWVSGPAGAGFAAVGAQPLPQIRRRKE